MFKHKVLGMVILVGMVLAQSVPTARAATVCDSVQFVSDLTIPDGSTFAPGASFTKTWRLLNNGTCTWTTSYKLVWSGGEPLGAPAAVILPVSVPPGQMLDLSVNLSAPSAAGHYKGLFKLSNTAGSTFGIGSSASDAFWVDINVVDTSAVIYDFVANASYAQWRSGAGALPFPGTSGDYRGYSLQIESPHLEDDSYDTAPGLLTVPQSKFNGYIQATYPEFQVQAGDRLQTLVNCEFGAAGCYTTFRIDYLLPNNVQRTLWTWKEAHDRRFYRANLDLSSLAGQKVRFVFMLLASGSAGNDRAIWGSPRIIRMGTSQPPAPPATLTPLPIWTPTATPLVPPPPTLQPTGCDRASFVADVTVQDGTVFAPGAAFTKTWRLKNAGACVWTTAYKLIYYSGEQMGAPTMVNLPWGAAPGQMVDVSVNMVAPSSAGNYRGYWILVNAKGQYFGISADASKPIWAEINVAGSSPTENATYDFVANVCSAEWKSSAGVLPCPGTDGDPRGFVMSHNPAKLEDGSTNLPGLLTSPQNRYNGYIQGYYPAFTVQPGDRFQSTVSCEHGSSCYVTYRLDYMTANGYMGTFWQWREQSDGKFFAANVDLSPLTGRSVRFILTILATGSASNDRAVWAAPRIVRASAPVTVTPSATFTPTFTPTPITVPGTVVTSPQIRRLFMTDATRGWATGNAYVLRTIDGGATWYNVTAQGYGAVSGAFFQNASKGWVIVTSTASGAPTLLRTTDGGGTWTAYANIPFNQGYLQFVDDSNGFVLSGLPSGMQKHAVQLYQTSDGGATWTLKYANDPSQPNNPLPFGGIKSGMAFRDTLRGWVGGEIPTPGFIYLYRTEDGGITWTHQDLAIPAGYESASIVTTAPVFFSQNDGILPVRMTNTSRDLFLYVTHDGGNTWSRSPAFAQQSVDMDSVSVQDAFSWNASGFLQVTSDAGATWRQVPSNVNFGEGLRDMDFVSATTGWMLDADENGNLALYRTGDGGATWTLLFGNTPTQLLPDLTVTSMRIELQNASCFTPGDLLGTRVSVKNNGQAAAGSFVLRVNNIDQTVNGLGVGETVTLFFPTTLNPVSAVADAAGTVTESDENNNTRSEWVPVPTPPLPCATPTFTPTPTLTGPYAVVRVAPNDVLNIRSGAGASHPIVGSFTPSSVNVMRTGPTTSAENATWVEVQNPSGGTGWVNSYYLSEYVTHGAFCADPRVPVLLEQLKGSMSQSNGDMFTALVSPTHGVDVRLWAYGPAHNFNTTAARNVFTSTETLNWGSGGGRGGSEPDMGTFSQVIQPKLQEVFNAPNMETYCDDLTKVYPLEQPWPYANTRYYNLYKPATPGIDFDFRTWLIGFEYIDGQPYLYSMVTIVWEP